MNWVDTYRCNKDYFTATFNFYATQHLLTDFLFNGGATRLSVIFRFDFLCSFVGAAIIG